jgi:hypothetical protein
MQVLRGLVVLTLIMGITTAASAQRPKSKTGRVKNEDSKYYDDLQGEWKIVKASPDFKVSMTVQFSNDLMIVRELKEEKFGGQISQGVSLISQERYSYELRSC